MKRQTDRNVTGFFQKLLELADPWRVVAVELKDEERSVEIEVEWPANYKASCPECGRACAVYDHAATRWWRHLDTMNRTTRLCCRVPRSECPTHGVKTMQVPWAAPPPPWPTPSTAEAAAWLAGAGLKGIGIDAPSFDAWDSDALPVHQRLLGAGLLLVENLTALDQLGGGDFFLSVLPLNIAGAEACPTRAVGILPSFSQW
mgnify:CR=1 FL=1